MLTFYLGSQGSIIIDFKSLEKYGISEKKVAEMRHY